MVRRTGRKGHKVAPFAAVLYRERIDGTDERDMSRAEKVWHGREPESCSFSVRVYGCRGAPVRVGQDSCGRRAGAVGVLQGVRLYM